MKKEGNINVFIEFYKFSVTKIMAVEVVETKGLWKKLQGIAADDKPVDDINGTLRIGNGSEFYELDTGKTFIYSIGNAQANSHWWEKQGWEKQVI